MPADVPEFSEEEVVRVIHEHIVSLFPKSCENCHQRFATYRDYLKGTKPLGFPVSYDIDAGDIKPAHSAGNLSLANCSCGGTMALSSEGMALKNLWGVLKWIEHETERRGVPPRLILVYLREAVSQRGLA